MFVVNEQVLSDVNKNFIIPPKPQILDDLDRLAHQNEPSLMAAADIVAKDVAIASAILKIVNSPAYGLVRSVSDIKQAIMFLGWNGIEALIPALKLKQMFLQKTCCISLERFWDNASEIANVNMIVGQRVKNKIPVEYLYTLGLFHDCGIVPMAIKYDDYVNVLHGSNRSSKESLVDIEDRVYGANHAIIGYYLASSWHLPRDICQLILRHHDLSLLEDTSDPNQQLCFCVLKLSESIVNSILRDEKIKDWEHLEPFILKKLNMSEDEYIDLQEEVIDYLNQ
ncbi:MULTISPECIES: HDOD domain-containing protein [unclassified Pseudoalteromonas]|uniref:HDOD domain-containing protein n=1 Tax=unclassified Pseudoalteromonas TaxID=194690 RepID=UPI0025B4D527|nr:MULTISPECIES: HDOD domain-containing protein [unclassified Pseudoalteromonas]MDN3429974.1 HDOD domain-containing protein [Pseudoalteromonas sp. APC 3907]MDN3463569.1 HDOD domain-containing protein [Pseudoalteromonas sp. APC 3495]